MSEERSRQSHDHYFAALTERWKSLSNIQRLEYPTVEALRHRALIKAGYYDVVEYKMPSVRDAYVLAGVLANNDKADCTVIEIVGGTVIHYTAKSQAYKAMGKTIFEKSKDAVLSICDELIGNTPKLD